MLLYFLSDFFHKFRIPLTLFHLPVFILSGIFHHISCHKSYASNIFHLILCQSYPYNFWNSILLISKLLYHQLIYLHHFHLFRFLYHAVLSFHNMLNFLCWYFPILSSLLSSIFLRCQTIFFNIFIFIDIFTYKMVQLLFIII